MTLIPPARDGASRAHPAPSNDVAYWQEFDAALRQFLGLAVLLAAIVAAALTLTGLTAHGRNLQRHCAACRPAIQPHSDTTFVAAMSLDSRVHNTSRTRP